MQLLPQCQSRRGDSKKRSGACPWLVLFPDLDFTADFHLVENIFSRQRLKCSCVWILELWYLEKEKGSRGAWSVIFVTRQEVSVYSDLSGCSKFFAPLTFCFRRHLETPLNSSKKSECANCALLKAKRHAHLSLVTCSLQHASFCCCDIVPNSQLT